MAPQVSILLASVGFNVLGQVFSRCLLYQKLMGSCASGFIVGLTALVVGHFLFSFSMGWFFLNLVVFLNLSYLYFQLFSIGENSVRIRLLYEINSLPFGISMEKLRQLYNEEHILQARLERLVSSGQLLRQGQVFFLGSPKLIYTAKILSFLKNIYFAGRMNKP